MNVYEIFIMIKIIMIIISIIIIIIINKLKPHQNLTEKKKRKTRLLKFQTFQSKIFLSALQPESAKYF